MSTEYAKELSWLKDDKDDVYDPTYNDVLRVAFMHMFDRAKLSDLVSLLSGRDFQEQSFKEEIAEQSFVSLKTGVKNFINQHNFESFLANIKGTGFVSPKLVTSRMAIDFAYTVFLLLRRQAQIALNEIPRLTMKWYIFSTLTGRYSSYPESQMDRDLREIKSKGFIDFFNDYEASRLSETFWNAEIVKNLETTSTLNLCYCAFQAAQASTNTKSLFSHNLFIRDLITQDGEVHHIFPKKFLKQNGYSDKTMYNQIANLTWIDSGINVAIFDKAPAQYFSIAREQCEQKDISRHSQIFTTIADKDEFTQNLKDNCIPDDIFDMSASDYPEFLKQRRELMAKKLKEFYEHL